MSHYDLYFVIENQVHAHLPADLDSKTPYKLKRSDDKPITDADLDRVYSCLDCFPVGKQHLVDLRKAPS